MILIYVKSILGVHIEIIYHAACCIGRNDLIGMTITGRYFELYVHKWYRIFWPHPTFGPGTNMAIECPKSTALHGNQNPEIFLGKAHKNSIVVKDARSITDCVLPSIDWRDWLVWCTRFVCVWYVFHPDIFWFTQAMWFLSRAKLIIWANVGFWWTRRIGTVPFLVMLGTITSRFARWSAL